MKIDAKCVLDDRTETTVVVDLDYVETLSDVYYWCNNEIPARSYVMLIKNEDEIERELINMHELNDAMDKIAWANI